MPRYLVTAGNTREMIDRVRDWGNVFTGNTGYAIAQALAEVGDVDLLTSNRQHIAIAESNAGRLSASAFTSHAELKAALAAALWRTKYDGIFMTAAVADYQPAGAFEVADRRAGPEAGSEIWTVRDVSAGKVKSSYRELAVLGRPTEKLVDLFRTEWGHTGLLVKFKLEVGIGREELIRVGHASRAITGADYLVANSLEMVDGPEAGAFLLSERGEEWVPRPALPERLALLAVERMSVARP